MTFLIRKDNTIPEADLAPVARALGSKMSERDRLVLEEYSELFMEQRANLSRGALLKYRKN